MYIWLCCEDSVMSLCAAGCFRFELSWPPSSVVPEPKKGELKPRWVCWFIPHKWELKPLWVLLTQGNSNHCGSYLTQGNSNQCGFYLTQGNSNHCESYLTQGNSNHCGFYLTQQNSNHCGFYLTQRNSNHCGSYLTQQNSNHCGFYLTKGNSKLKPRWHLRYIRELQKRVIWCVSGDCTLTSPCPFAASVFPDHISVLVMCHALCSQITSVSQSCVVPCVPRLHQCPSHVSCLVFPGYISVLNMCHAMCAQSVPVMCHALCSQITAVSKSCVMPYVPRSQQCPSHVFYVPRSSTSVEVWLHLAWQKRLSELPWRGEIVVTCNGKEKVGILSFSLPVSLLLPPPPSAQ